MDVRVLEHVTDGTDAVALLEQSHPGGAVLYVVTISVTVPVRRRAGTPQRITYSRCSTDRDQANELYRRARDDFFPEEEEEPS